jgi:hypothetical protein
MVAQSAGEERALAATVTARAEAKKATRLRLLRGGKGGGVESFGGYELDGEGVRHKERAKASGVARLSERDVVALRTVFGGLESSMGLASSMGAQIAMLAAAPDSPCGHRPARVVEWQGGDGEQLKVVTPEEPCRRRKRRGPAKVTRAAFAVLMGAPVNVDLVDAEKVAEVEPGPGILPPPSGGFLVCGTCQRKASCPDCGECKHCGGRAWTPMHVSGSRAAFDTSEVMHLEAVAWGGGLAGYRRTRDTLLRMVADGQTGHVVVLSRMYSGEASAEHSRRWPKLGDVVPLATLTEAVLARAEEMTKRVRRQARAAAFEVSAFAALESAMAADNAGANATEIRRQAERLLERASAAYTRAARALAGERKVAGRSARAVAKPWRRAEEGEDVD